MCLLTSCKVYIAVERGITANFCIITAKKCTLPTFTSAELPLATIIVASCQFDVVFWSSGRAGILTLLAVVALYLSLALLTAVYVLNYRYRSKFDFCSRRHVTQFNAGASSAKVLGICSL